MWINNSGTLLNTNTGARFYIQTCEVWEDYSHKITFSLPSGGTNWDAMPVACYAEITVYEGDKRQCELQIANILNELASEFGFNLVRYGTKKDYQPESIIIPATEILY